MGGNASVPHGPDKDAPAGPQLTDHNARLHGQVDQPPTLVPMHLIEDIVKEIQKTHKPALTFSEGSFWQICLDVKGEIEADVRFQRVVEEAQQRFIKEYTTVHLQMCYALCRNAGRKRINVEYSQGTIARRKRLAAEKASVTKPNTVEEAPVEESIAGFDREEDRQEQKHR